MNELTDPDFTLCKDESLSTRVELVNDLKMIDKIIIVTKSLADECFYEKLPLQTFTHNDITTVSLYSESKTAFCVINDYSFPGSVCSVLCSVIDATSCGSLEIYSTSIASSLGPTYVDGEFVNEKTENFVFCWSNAKIHNSITSGNLPHISSIGPLIHSLHPKLNIKAYCEVFHEKPFILSEQISKFT